jgi:hypothetical protein
MLEGVIPRLSRFVGPQTETLTLDNGDTLLVRRRLNMGEFRASSRLCYEVHENGGPPTLILDPTRQPMAKVAAYLVDWQLVDAPPIRDLDLSQRFAVLDNLDPTEFLEVLTAVNGHEMRQVMARLEEKKLVATMNAAPTSSSPSAAGGASTGSASLT